MTSLPPLSPSQSPCAETLVSYMYGQNHVLFVRYEGAALGLHQPLRDVFLVLLMLLSLLSLLLLMISLLLRIASTPVVVSQRRQLGGGLPRDAHPLLL